MSSAKKRRDLAKAQGETMQAQLKASAAEVQADIWKFGCQVMQARINHLEATLQQSREALVWVNSRWADVSTLTIVREALAAIDTASGIKN